MQPPIFLYTDFGSADLYVGQVKSVLYREAPGCVVIDLFNDAPSFRVPPAAHLLAALAPRLPPGAVILAVVDPGVGGERSPVVVEADGRWFVGPDNGLMSVVTARARGSRSFPIGWMAEPESVSFHGRDLFAGAAARIASGLVDFTAIAPNPRLDVEFGGDDLPQIVYIDHYGNAMTGLRADRFDEASWIEVGARAIPHARVFSAVALGELFWYGNSIGLVELAANQASAADMLELAIGQPVALVR